MVPFAAALLLGTSAVSQSPDPAQAAAEFSTYCAGGKALWGRSLCGPLLFVDPGSKAAAATFDPNLPGFHKEASVWKGSLPTNVGIANTSVELGGKRVAEILLPLPADPLARRVLLSHESFHRIQPDLGFKGLEADNGHLDQRDARIYARLEIAALKAALTQTNWRGSARDALSYRAARLARFKEAAASEASLIANEGLAEYTGVRVGAGAKATTMAIRDLDGATERASLIRSFGYVVGPAYGLLLDRTGRNWRPAALKGRPMPELLQTALAGPVSPKLAGTQYGGAQIVSEETARDAKIQRRRAELTAELIDGPTVTFPFEKMSIDFNPNTLFSLGEAGTVYSQSTTIRDAWGWFKATGDVLLSPDWKFARLRGPAKMEGRTISGPGWSAELAEGYSAVAGTRAGDLVIRKR